jgi:hypothetical protein
MIEGMRTTIGSDLSVRAANQRVETRIKFDVLALALAPALALLLFICNVHVLQ